MTDTSALTKKWYQSKIVIFSGVAVLVFGGNLLLGSLFRSGVTAQQVSDLQMAYPQGVEIVERLQSGENAASLFGLIFNFVILVARGWFTSVPNLSK